MGRLKKASEKKLEIQDDSKLAEVRNTRTDFKKRKTEFQGICKGIRYITQINYCQQ